MESSEHPQIEQDVTLINKNSEDVREQMEGVQYQRGCHV